ncbi:hypothetical protein BRADI_4g39381v3 [Brachypodium distachyon]|uniref:Uncharacterized protein n=1 Tax=Brachypodium distachyon TaxID=15368 RepID=A0A2K2CTA2_BRADI|nr:hypothetical protein BRADI_4g39381v3 [Brachypodium distachyon]
MPLAWSSRTASSRCRRNGPQAVRRRAASRMVADPNGRRRQRDPTSPRTHPRPPAGGRIRSQPPCGSRPPGSSSSNTRLPSPVALGHGLATAGSPSGRPSVADSASPTLPAQKASPDSQYGHRRHRAAPNRCHRRVIRSADFRKKTTRYYKGIFHALSTICRDEGGKLLYRSWATLLDMTSCTMVVNLLHDITEGMASDELITSKVVTMFVYEGNVTCLMMTYLICFYAYYYIWLWCLYSCAVYLCLLGFY